MGEVFRAYDDRLDRWVAIKLIRSKSPESGATRRRFRREARAAARLSHPAIVQIHDILESDDGDSIVMELVEGQSMTHLLDRGPLDVGQALRLAQEIAEGLAEAHGKGIVHRDLKADNVMVTASGHIKILDFGLAKRLSHHESHLTADGGIVGTVHAMSPEQARGFEIDHRSDLFSLGSLLYQTLTGKSPFLGRDPLHTLSRIGTFRQTPVHTVNPRVPPAFSRLIDRLLEKDPLHRPQSADEVTSDLADVAAAWETGSRKISTVAPEPNPDGEPMLDSPTLTQNLPTMPYEAAPLEPQTSEKEVEAAPNRRRLNAAAAAASLLLLGLLGIWIVPRLHQERLHVAVLKPRLTEASEIQDPELVTSAVRLALIQALLSRRGISTPEPGHVDTVSGSPAQVARALGVDEVIASNLTCTPRTCQIELQRILGDGSIFWAEVFRAYPGELLDLTSAVTMRLQNGFPKHKARVGALDLAVGSADYEEYLRLRESWRTRTRGTSTTELLAAVTALENTSPRFLEAYLLEARIAQSLFISSRQAKDFELALDAVRRARDLAPDDSRALFTLFNLAIDGRRPEQAEKALEALKRVEPGHGRILAQEALLLELRGQTEKALDRMRTAAERHASWANLMDLARMEVRAGEFDAARNRLRQLLERAPGNYLALFQLAIHEMTYGSLEQAIELFEKLHRQDPTDIGTWQNIGLNHFGLGRYQDAEHWFGKVLEQKPSHLPTTAALAFTRFLLGEHEDARALAAHTLELTDEGDSATSKAELYYLQAMAEAAQGQSERAVAAVQQILPAASANPFVAWQTALIYAAVGEQLSAKSKAREALEQGLTPGWFASPLFDFLKDDPELSKLLVRHKD